MRVANGRSVGNYSCDPELTEQRHELRQIDMKMESLEL